MNIEKALSIRQPWAWLVCRRYKDTENREWPFPGTIGGLCVKLPLKIYVHTGISKSDMTEDVKDSILPLLDIRQRYEFLAAYHSLAFGAIIGEVTITGCKFRFPDENDNLYSLWHMRGQYGFALADGALYDKPIPCKGSLGLFMPKLFEVHA